MPAVGTMKGQGQRLLQTETMLLKIFISLKGPLSLYC